MCLLSLSKRPAKQQQALRSPPGRRAGGKVKSCQDSSCEAPRFCERQCAARGIVAKREDAGRSGVLKQSLLKPSLLGLADARRLAELLGHVEMVLERRQRLAGPILQVGIVAALGVTLEQRDRILMGTDLVRIVIRAEVLAIRALELVELALMRAVERRRKGRLHLAAADEALEFAAGLGVVGHHLLRKSFLLRVALLLGKLARLDLEHVADGDFLDEVGGGRRDAERRVDAGLLAERLGERGPCEQHAGSCDDGTFHGPIPSNGRSLSPRDIAPTNTLQRPEFLT